MLYLLKVYRAKKIKVYLFIYIYIYIYIICIIVLLLLWVGSRREFLNNTKFFLLYFFVFLFLWLITLLLYSFLDRNPPCFLGDFTAHFYLVKNCFSGESAA